MKSYAFIALAVLLWGIWGFCGKIATRYNPPLAVTAISYLTFPLASLLLFMAQSRLGGPAIDWGLPAVTAILLTTVAAILGSVSYYLALAHAPASVVVSLTAIYPAVTVVLAMAFLGERLTWLQGLGLLLLVVGTCLVSLKP